VTLFVLALALGATPATRPTPAPGWVVVQRDGSLVQLAREPARKGNVLVGTLFPEGNLVSIRVEDVDEARTSDANRARKAGIEAAPARSLAPGAPALGDQVRLAPPKASDAAHRELDAARKALADALEEKRRFEQEVPPGGEKARVAWAQGLQDRTNAVERARRRVDRARRRVDEEPKARRR
jgi:hypothetical protein